MVDTRDRFTDGHLNIKLVDDAEWKLDLDLLMAVQKKYEKDQDAWIENRHPDVQLGPTALPARRQGGAQEPVKMDRQERRTERGHLPAYATRHHT